MTPAQCRAARAWLSWSQDDLAKAARVGLSTVKDFEGERRTPIEATQTAMGVALEREGIGFPFAEVDGVKKACGITPRPRIVGLLGYRCSERPRAAALACQPSSFHYAEIASAHRSRPKQIIKGQSAATVHPSSNVHPVP